MANPRKHTCKLLEMVDSGILSADDVMFQSTPGGDPPGDVDSGILSAADVMFQSTPGGDPPGDFVRKAG